MAPFVGHGPGLGGQRDQGVKGTRSMQAIFRELCRPTSCFQCSLCEAVVSPSSSCLEHACIYHPTEMENLSFNYLSLFSQMQTLPFSPRVNVCLTVVVFGPLSTVINHSHSALSVTYCITMCIHPLGHCYIIIQTYIYIYIYIYPSREPSAQS